MPETRDLPRLSTRAALQPKSFDAENRTVEVTWSTGATVRRFDLWDGPYLEELSLDPAHVRMDRLNSGAPVLGNHNAYDLSGVIGVVERAWIDDGKGRAVVRFSERDDVASILADVRSGILRNVSVGYQVHEYEVEKPTEKGGMPLFRAIDWEPMEVSLVTVPADASAQIRGSSELHPVVLTMRNPAMSDPNENAPVEEAPVTPIEPEVPDAPEISQRAIKAERARVAGILDAVRTARLDADLADKLIASGRTLDECRADVIRAWSAKVDATATPSRIEAGASSDDKFRRGVSAALAHRMGFAKDDPANEFRGRALHEIAARSIELSGGRTHGLTRSEIAGMVLRAHSTSDFPYLMADAANKSLQRAYENFPSTWTKIAAVGEVSDFKTINMVRLGSFSSLDTILEGGEYTQGTISEERSTLTAVTKGKFIQLTRQMIINDDLSGFSRMAQMLGRAAARTVNSDVYSVINTNAALGDGYALFSSDHGNLAGSSTVVTVAALGAGRKAMRIQKDPTLKDYLNIMPRTLLVPVTIEDHARTVVSSQYNTDTTAQLKRNIVLDWGPLEVVSDPYLDASSATAWYLIADPMDAPLLEVRFLDGQQTPYVGNDEEFLTDAIRWKVRLDYGVAANDYRGGYKNAGA